MGDSCTEFGRYPQRTVEDLAGVIGHQPDGIHLAAGGWTSQQGLAQLERDVIPLHPRAVVVYYGWNDHWIALGPTDSQLRRAHRWIWLSEHSRVMQAALKAWMGLASRGAERPQRVPPTEYVSNLREIARLARSAGITPVFVTAPSNHVPGREPAYLLRRHVNRLADVVPLHLKYVELTREAARSADGVLCDAFDAFRQLPDNDRLFKADGIHFTDAGDIALGHIVGRCLAPFFQ
jgi:lysophospholipase L1-like esterase